MVPAHVLKQVVSEEREKPAPDLLEVQDVLRMNMYLPCRSGWQLAR